MSVIVAVKGDGCVYLAADSQATNGSSRLILDEKHGKLRQITPQLAVGCTRSMAQLQCLIGISWDGCDAWSLEAVAVRIYAGMRHDLSTNNLMERNKQTGAEELPGTLVIAWKDDFVEVDAGGQLIKPAAPWHAIGSGADVARGALYVMNSNMADLMAHGAGRAACSLDTYCSEPIITAVTRP